MNKVLTVFGWIVFGLTALLFIAAITSRGWPSVVLAIVAMAAICPPIVRAIGTRTPGLASRPLRYILFVVCIVSGLALFPTPDAVPRSDQPEPEPVVLVSAEDQEVEKIAPAPVTTSLAGIWENMVVTPEPENEPRFEFFYAFHLHDDGSAHMVISSGRTFGLDGSWTQNGNQAKITMTLPEDYGERTCSFIHNDGLLCYDDNLLCTAGKPNFGLADMGCYERKGASLAFPPGDALFDGRLAGTIDDLMVGMHLRISAADRSVGGHYYYVKKKKAIELQGTLDERNQLVMTESVGGQTTGTFQGVFEPDMGIAGTWKSPNGRTLNFFLKSMEP